MSRHPVRRWTCGVLALAFLVPVFGIGSTASAGPSPDPTCRSLFPGFEDDTPAGRCHPVDEIVIDDATVRVYVHEDVADAPDAEVRERTADAVQRSFLEYTLLGVMPPVDIVVVPELSVDAYAESGPDDRGTCVTFVSRSTYRRDRLYRHTLAHELFHCFQFKQLGIEIWDAEDEGGEWWVEGTAEYFANVVYPDDNLEREYLAFLRSSEPRHSLVDVSVGAYVFFQHFANRHGNPAVVEFMQTMPATGGRADQMATAAAWPGMDELFHDYARAFLSDEIVDANGATIPVRARQETRGSYVIDREQEVFEFDDLEPFEIHRLRMRFESRHTFDLDYLESAGVRSAAQEPRAPWEELPDPVETCDEHRFLRLLMTTTANDAQSAKLDVLTATASDPDNESTVCCLADAESRVRDRAARRQVRIVVCGAIQAEFVGGVCWVEGEFLMVTAGYNAFPGATRLATGPYPRGYTFILGLSQPGFEPSGDPNVSITDGTEIVHPGAGATLTKSDDLLTGTFTAGGDAGSIAGSYRCPRLTPVEELP
ncbi:MAG: hypothetical protein WD598_01105 [Acidimicrobiia bacterium]